MILRLRLIALLVDYALILGSFVLAYFIRVGFIFSSDFSFGPYFSVAALTSIAWILFLILFRVYRLQGRWKRWQHYCTLYAGNLAGVAVFGLLFFSFNKEFFSRLLLVYTYFLACGLLTVSHLIFEQIQCRLVDIGKGVIRVLVLGSNRSAEATIRMLLSQKSHFVPVAVLDGYGASVSDICDVPVLGKLNKLEQTVEEELIDHIIQVDNLEQTLNVINFCHQRNIGYSLSPSLLGVYHDNIRIDTLEGKPIVRAVNADRSFFDIIFGL
jgi:FlaA1/EpsC-like NDP-sugar epimerase